MARIHDISMLISPDMPAYPGDAPVEIKPVKSMSRGAEYNTSLYCFGSHAGTHLDAQCHFIPGGQTVDEIDPSRLVGEALVVDLTEVDGTIEPADLQRHPEIRSYSRLIFKTKNTQYVEGKDFHKNFIAVSGDAATYLIDLGVKLVGVDYLSVEPFGSESHSTHRQLLANGVVPVEGLDLSGIDPGPYTLVVLPLKVRGGDGSPARAILIED
jgi:arylformamidase